MPPPPIPASPVFLYGQVSPASPAPDLSTVSFTLTGNGETLTTATPAQLVTVEGQGGCLMRVPVETRALLGAPARTPTLGMLALEWKHQFKLAS